MEKCCRTCLYWERERDSIGRLRPVREHSINQCAYQLKKVDVPESVLVMRMYPYEGTNCVCWVKQRS